MRFAILIPHWRTGEMTAFVVSQLLKLKGKHDIDIVVIDNNAGDGSAEHLMPFLKYITIVEYPKDRIQSHGAAFDHVLPAINNEWFITLESDAFPEKDNWLDYHEDLINKGYDSAGSLLKLSGGEIVHPCGALYRKSIWQEAKDYAEKMPYAYFPNMSVANMFDNHLMVHESIFDEFVKTPDDYVELADGYLPYTPLKAIEKLEYYSPIGKGVFHNGMGGRDEFLNTFGQRTAESEVPYILVNSNKKKIINRIGYEPGAWMFYWQIAMGKKIFYIPTETKWMDGKINQNQEYTLMENGLKHIWAGSAYLSMKDTEMHDVYDFKKKQIEQLYNSIKNNQ